MMKWIVPGHNGIFLNRVPMELCRSGSGIPVALKVPKNEDQHDAIHASLAV